MNLQGLTVGQFFPGDSALHRLDPRTKILGVLVLSVVMFLPRGWLGQGLAAGFTFMLVLLSQVPLRMIIRGLRPLMIFLAIALLFNTFLTPGEVLARLGPLTVTREGLILSLTASVRLILLVVVASLLTLTTSPIRLTDGLERLLRPFQRLGVPAHEIALMMTIALRFIPTIAEEADRIMRAQTARGAAFRAGGMVERVKALVPLLVPLFVAAFRRADELATAMEARGYRGGAGRTRMQELALSGLDWVAIGVLAVFAAGMLALRLTGQG